MSDQKTVEASGLRLVELGEKVANSKFSQKIGYVF
jgi:hypothetical protein